MSRKRKSAPVSVGPEVEIYGLIDPRSGALRYIGKAVDSGARLASHLRDSVRRKTPVCMWIRELTADGAAPDVVVLDAVPAQEWKGRERFWIARGRERGLPLLNVADGGNQPSSTAEQRRCAQVAAMAAMAEKHAKFPIEGRLLNMKRGVSSIVHGYTLRGDLSAAYAMRFKMRIYGASIKSLAAWAGAL